MGDGASRFGHTRRGTNGGKTQPGYSSTKEFGPFWLDMVPREVTYDPDEAGNDNADTGEIAA